MNESSWMIGRTMMTNQNQDKDHKDEAPSGKKKGKDSPDILSANKPSRLAERKGQRPAFPFRRKPV